MITEKQFNELASHMDDETGHLDLTTQYRIERTRTSRKLDYDNADHRANVMLNADLLGVTLT